MTLRLLNLAWRLSLRLTCWLSRRHIIAICRERVEHQEPEPDPRISWSSELSADEWPPCTAFTVGVALGGHGGRYEA
jgi:hypothetical protein